MNSYPYPTELKFFDTPFSFTFGTTAAVEGSFNLIPQGAQQSARVGRQCVVRKVLLKGALSRPPSAFSQLACVNFIYIVLDTQCNGAAASVTDVVTSATLESALPSVDNEDRFIILDEIQMEMPAEVEQANSSCQMLNWEHTCTIPLDFSGATGAITELRSNNIFLMAGAFKIDDEVDFVGTGRVWYSDY